MNWPMKASQSQAMSPRSAAYTTPNLYMGSLVKNWKGGSTRGYLTIWKMHSKGSWTLNLGRILTLQCIHTQNVNEINHIDISSNYQEFEVNEAQHICNPNYKGKNYDPNYQKNKNNQNNSSNSTFNKNNNSNNGSNNGTTSRNFRSKGDYTEMPSNVEVTLKGPVNQDQLMRIKAILKNPWIYKDKVQKNQYPASSEYTKSFSKFCPKKIEVNEATVDVIHYGMHLKKSELEMAEAIDIYKALGDDTCYGLEEQSPDPPQHEDQ